MMMWSNPRACISAVQAFTHAVVLVLIPKALWLPPKLKGTTWAPHLPGQLGMSVFTLTGETWQGVMGLMLSSVLVESTASVVPLRSTQVVPVKFAGKFVWL